MSPAVAAPAAPLRARLFRDGEDEGRLDVDLLVQHLGVKGAAEAMAQAEPSPPPVLSLIPSRPPQRGQRGRSAQPRGHRGVLVVPAWAS